MDHQRERRGSAAVGVRAAAIAVIFMVSFSGSEPARASSAGSCETAFFFCIEEENCGEGAECTFADCEGEVECLDGPGCPDGVALVCNPE